MQRKRIRLWAAVCAALALGWAIFQSACTHTLTDKENTRVKAEELQPLWGSLTVKSSAETSVTFTDTETGDTFVLEYVTPGMPEKLRLARGRWYTVESGASVTVRPAVIRVR